MSIYNPLMPGGPALLEHLTRPSPARGLFSVLPHPRSGRLPPRPLPLIEVALEILVDGAITVARTALKAGSFTPGDHLKVLYGGYSHHCIYIGWDEVIHLSKQSGCVEQVSLERFRDGRVQIWVVPSPRTFPEVEVVRRAKSRLGEGDYDLLSNNCEHFANWCRSGKSLSRQVERWES